MAASAARCTRACAHLPCATASFELEAVPQPKVKTGGIIAARTAGIEHEGQVPHKRRSQTQHAMPRASPLACRLYPAPSLQLEVGAG